jgi:hypothetical protein
MSLYHNCNISNITKICTNLIDYCKSYNFTNFTNCNNFYHCINNKYENLCDINSTSNIKYVVSISLLFSLVICFVFGINLCKKYTLRQRLRFRERELHLNNLNNLNNNTNIDLPKYEDIENDTLNSQRPPDYSTII